MFCEVDLVMGVFVLADKLDKESPVTSKSIITTQLLKDLLREKASKECGYFLKVTALSMIGEGRIVNDSRKMLFPVAFSCRTFIPCQGEILEGVVHGVHNLGVFIRCGPLKYAFLSARKMPNYHYVDGTNPFFLRGDFAMIGKEVVVRFMVLQARWIVKVYVWLPGSTRKSFQNDFGGKARVKNSNSADRGRLQVQIVYV